MLEVTSQTLRPGWSRYSEAERLQPEIQLIFIRDSGSISGAQNINLKATTPTTTALVLGDDALKVINDRYVFAGSSIGFHT